MGESRMILEMDEFTSYHVETLFIRVKNLPRKSLCLCVKMRLMTSD